MKNITLKLEIWILLRVYKQLSIKGKLKVIKNKLVIKSLLEVNQREIMIKLINQKKKKKNY
jgi:hypothetical protein